MLCLLIAFACHYRYIYKLTIILIQVESITTDVVYYMEKADTELYLAKTNGRNRVVMTE